MSSDCSSEKHFLSVISRCSSLTSMLLRTFVSRDIITMFNLFQSLMDSIE